MIIHEGAFEGMAGGLDLQPCGGNRGRFILHPRMAVGRVVMCWLAGPLYHQRDHGGDKRMAETMIRLPASR